MFRSATVKLTLSYLAIIMALCLMFSGAIYQSATQELRDNLARQSQRLNDRFPNVNFAPALRTESIYNESRRQIVLSLAYLNLGVLVFAGFASFGLARWTLKPIEESHEQQKRFTSDVSHELRTPLTALKMTTEVALLDTAAGKADLRKTLQSNLGDIAKLEALVNNLLRLTRLEATELQQHFSDVSLRDIVDEAIAGVADKASAKQIKLETTVPKGLAVFGDQPSLVQLFTVFFDNAIKYSPKKSTVTLTAKQKDDEISLTIADQGMGIAAYDLPQIFDRFYQADSARTSNDSSGYGLGLSIAKMIADVHHGRLSVASQLAEGTTITVVLPAAQA